MKINFYSDSDLEDFKEAVLEYEKIWNEDGFKILESWEKHTGLKFRESHINAIVWDGMSMSHPLGLRYNLLPDGKKATLAHELGHRILYKRVSGMEKSSLDRHKFMNLMFYYVLKDVFGDAMTRIIEWESNRPDTKYKEAWDWVLNFGDENRKKRFRGILEGDLSLLS